jgi:hypothetical protein
VQVRVLAVRLLAEVHVNDELARPMRECSVMALQEASTNLSGCAPLRRKYERPLLRYEECLQEM